MSSCREVINAVLQGSSMIVLTIFVDDTEVEKHHQREGLISPMKKSMTLRTGVIEVGWNIIEHSPWTCSWELIKIIYSVN